MVVVKLVVYVLCDAVGFLVAYLLPDGPWTPYLPLMIAYHLFLIFLIVSLAVSDEQKIGLSMPIPMIVITHLAFLGALIGVVFGREYVPFFGFVRYALPALAPFEAQWLFEGKRKDRSTEERPLPAGTAEDYDQFLKYMREKDRRFMQPGRSVHDEFAAWSADRAKRRSAQETENKSA